jgi:hypothetical protein
MQALETKVRRSRWSCVPLAPTSGLWLPTWNHSHAPTPDARCQPTAMSHRDVPTSHPESETFRDIPRHATGDVPTTHPKSETFRDIPRHATSDVPTTHPESVTFRDIPRHATSDVPTTHPESVTFRDISRHATIDVPTTHPESVTFRDIPTRDRRCPGDHPRKCDIPRHRPRMSRRDPPKCDIPRHHLPIFENLNNPPHGQRKCNTMHHRKVQHSATLLEAPRGSGPSFRTGLDVGGKLDWPKIGPDPVQHGATSGSATSATRCNIAWRQLQQHAPVVARRRARTRPGRRLRLP